MNRGPERSSPAARALSGKSEQGWQVRPYRQGDEERIVDLFNRTFANQITVAEYLWKFRIAGYDLKQNFVATCDGDIIGHYGGTPMRFKLGDRECMILHVADVMTDAAFRGQGVLSALGVAAHRQWRADGIPFVTGLHYGGWGTRRHYLGWREKYRAHWLIALLQPDAGAKRLHHRLPARAANFWDSAGDVFLNRFSRKVAIEKLVAPLPTLDELWLSVRNHIPASVVRDRRWLNYRYFSAPAADYQILAAGERAFLRGYLCYRTDDFGGTKRAQIADFLCRPGDHATLAALLLAMKEDLRSQEVQTIRVLCPVRSWWFKWLLLSGFLPVRQGFDISIVPLSGTAFPLLSAPKTWFTTAGDFDVV